MKKKDLAIFIFLFTASAFLSTCQKSGKSVNFANVCQAENHSIVEIKGFLYLPKATSPATPDLTPHQLLLVENKNGTGGFIEIANNESDIFPSKDGVKITGEILKEKNMCVLKINKIETP